MMGLHTWDGHSQGCLAPGSFSGSLFGNQNIAVLFGGYYSTRWGWLLRCKEPCTSLLRDWAVTDGADVAALCCWMSCASGHCSQRSLGRKGWSCRVWWRSWECFWVDRAPMRNKVWGENSPFTERTIEVILLYHEALPQDTFTTEETTPQQSGTKELAETSRDSCVSLLCSPWPCCPRRWQMLSREAELVPGPGLDVKGASPCFSQPPVWWNGKHENVRYHSSLHGYSLCVLD